MDPLVKVFKVGDIAQLRSKLESVWFKKFQKRIENSTGSSWAESSKKNFKNIN